MREACQECMLFRRYCAAFLPLLQSGEYGHEVFVLRVWGDAAGSWHSIRERFCRSMNLPIVHCAGLDEKQGGRILRCKPNWWRSCGTFHVAPSGDPFDGASLVGDG